MQKKGTLADDIKRLRKKKKISQDKLSKIADIAYNTIIKIERGGVQNPRIKTIKSLAKALDITIDKLAKNI